MYIIPPSYYLKRALTAQTVQDSVKYWACHWDCMYKRGMHTLEQYRQAATNIISGTADQKSDGPAVYTDSAGH